MRESLRSVGLEGKEGAIRSRCGSLNYVALDVVLYDGRSELFWHYELEEAEDGARP